MLVPVDKVPVFGENRSENGSAGVDPAPGGSGESDGDFHVFILGDNRSEYRKNRRISKSITRTPSVLSL